MIFHSECARKDPRRGVPGKERGEGSKDERGMGGKEDDGREGRNGKRKGETEGE